MSRPVTREVGQQLAEEPLPRYFAVRAAGMAMFIFTWIGIILGAVVVAVDGAVDVGIIAFLGGGFIAYLSSGVAFSRRVRVFENGLVPSVLPLSERFRLRTPVLSRKDISEISNMITAGENVGLVFEARGSTARRRRVYYVTKASVGAATYEAVLDFKHRFYS